MGKRRETYNRRRALGAGAALVSGASLIGFASSDTTVGTVDVRLNGTNNGVSDSFSITNAKPGDTATHDIALQNVGSASADHVEILISATENDTRNEPSDTDLNTELNASETAQHIEVITYEYRDNGGMVLKDILTDVSDTNNNGIIDLDDVINQTAAADDLQAPLANSGDTTHLIITVAIANDDGSFTGSDEDIMADGIDVRIEFTLNQAPSQ